VSVTNFTGTSVAAGGFSVTFDLTCLGTGTGTVSFANNDFDENPYNSPSTARLRRKSM